MSLIEKLLQIKIDVSGKKTEAAGKKKDVLKTDGKSSPFGATLAEVGSAPKAGKNEKAADSKETGVKKVKLSRGGLEVTISYPKSLLGKKNGHAGEAGSNDSPVHPGLRKHGSKEVKAGHGLFSHIELEEKPESSKKADFTQKFSGGKGSVKEAKSLTDVDPVHAKKASSKKSALKPDSSSKNDGKKTHSKDKNKQAPDSSILAATQAALANGASGKISEKGPEGKKESDKTGSKTSKTKKDLSSKASVGISKAVIGSVAKNPGGTGENEKIASPEIAGKETKVSGKSPDHSGGDKFQLHLQKKSGSDPKPPVNTQNGVPASASGKKKPEDMGMNDPARNGKAAVKAVQASSAQAPEVVRDRYYGQRVVHPDQKHPAHGESGDKVEITRKDPPPQHDHTLGGTKKAGTAAPGGNKNIQSAQQNKPGSHSGNAAGSGNQNLQKAPQPAGDSSQGNNAAQNNALSTQKQPVQVNTGANTVVPGSLYQMNTPQIIAQRLVAVAQKLPQSAPDPQLWHKHRLVMDNGQSLNVAARTANGILHLQLSAGNGDLNKFLQQNMSQIRNHLQNNLNLHVDLQFQNPSGGGQASQQFQQQPGNKNGFVAPANFGNDFSEKTAPEPQRRPVGTRRLGYNNTEWTA